MISPLPHSVNGRLLRCASLHAFDQQTRKVANRLLATPSQRKGRLDGLGACGFARRSRCCRADPVCRQLAPPCSLRETLETLSRRSAPHAVPYVCRDTDHMCGTTNKSEAPHTTRALSAAAAPEPRLSLPRNASTTTRPPGLAALLHASAASNRCARSRAAAAASALPPLCGSLHAAAARVPRMPMRARMVLPEALCCRRPNDATRFTACQARRRSSEDRLRLVVTGRRARRRRCWSAAGARGAGTRRSGCPGAARGW